MAGALSELSDKIDRIGAPTDLAPFEDLLQDAIARLDALDAKVDAGPLAPGDSTHLELAIRELTEKLGATTRAHVDLADVFRRCCRSTGRFDGAPAYYVRGRGK